MGVQYRTIALVLGMLMILLYPIGGCSSESEREELSRLEEETGEAVDAAGDYLSEQRREAVSELRDAYDSVTDRIREFEETHSGKLSEAQRELMDDLRQKRIRIEEKLEKARTVGEESWDELKRDIAASVDELEEAFSDIRSRFEE